MIDLKEKEDVLEDEISLKIPSDQHTNRPRVKPSRASYYQTYGFRMSESQVPEETESEDYSIKLVKANKTLTPNISNTVNYDNALDVSDLDYTTIERPDYKIYKNLTSELMPSSETMSALKDLSDEEEAEKEVVSFKINKKGILLLFIFAVVIISLFTLIIINAISLVGLGNETGSLQQQVATQQSSIDALQADINNISNNLDGQAASNGYMLNPGSGTIIVDTQMPVQQDFAGSTNIFDWILNTLFGWM